MQGSYLFSYTVLTDEKISLTGIAVGKTTVLVLPYDAIQAARNYNEDFNGEIQRVEEYITSNGVPQCDYTKFVGHARTVQQRFQETVKKLIALRRVE